MPTILANRWQWILQNPKRKYFSTLPMHPPEKQSNLMHPLWNSSFLMQKPDIWSNKANLSKYVKIISRFKQKCARFKSVPERSFCWGVDCAQHHFLFWQSILCPKVVPSMKESWDEGAYIVWLFHPQPSKFDPLLTKLFCHRHVYYIV